MRYATAVAVLGCAAGACAFAPLPAARAVRRAPALTPVAALPRPTALFAPAVADPQQQLQQRAGGAVRRSPSPLFATGVTGGEKPTGPLGRLLAALRAVFDFFAKLLRLKPRGDGADTAAKVADVAEAADAADAAAVAAPAPVTVVPDAKIVEKVKEAFKANPAASALDPAKIEKLKEQAKPKNTKAPLRAATNATAAAAPAPPAEAETAVEKEETGAEAKEEKAEEAAKVEPAAAAPKKKTAGSNAAWIDQLESGELDRAVTEWWESIGQKWEKANANAKAPRVSVPKNPPADE